MRAPIVALAAVVVTIALGSCATPRDPLPLPGAATPTPTPTSPALAGNPVPFTCAEALPPEELAALPDAWTLDTSFRPDAGSSAEQAVDIDGFACGFTSSAGASLVVAVANPNAASQSALKSQFSRASDPTTDLFATAFFSPGDAEIFPGTYWISLVSPTFAQASDAKNLADLIIQTIPSG